MFPVGALDKPAVRALGARARPGGLGEAGQPRDLLRRRRRSRGLSRAARRRKGDAAPSAMSPAASSAPTTACTASRSASAKGLGLSSPVRLYVVGIDAEQGAVTVGPREALERVRAHRVRRELDRRRAAGRRHPRRRRRSAIAIARRRSRSRRWTEAACTWPSTSRSTRSRQARRSSSTTGGGAGWGVDQTAGSTWTRSGVQLRFAQVLRHAVQVFLGVDRRHAA